MSASLIGRLRSSAFRLSTKWCRRPISVENDPTATSADRRVKLLIYLAVEGSFFGRLFTAYALHRSQKRGHRRLVAKRG
jgi:heme/copper-type cytochrome/quinol oxidase subunit 3